jgi:hypothetical protein
MKIGLLKTLHGGDKVSMQIIAFMRFWLRWLFNNTSWLHISTFTSLLLAGCGNTVSWDEEVKLRTGETITVEREVKHVSGGDQWPQGQGTVPKEHIIRFTYPPNTKSLIEWRSKNFDLPRGSYAELPLVLDLSKDNTLFIFTIQGVGEDCLRYVKYQFQQGHWIEIPYSDKPIDIHKTNLLLSAGSNAISGNITLEKKNQEIANSNVWFYKQVGPNEVTPIYFKGREKNQKPPLKNLLICVLEDNNSIFKMISIDGVRK